MADFIPYEKQRRVERDVNPDKVVRLAPDRWASLVEYIRVNYADLRPGVEIKVYEPTEVSGILYLPALYQAA